MAKITALGVDVWSTSLDLSRKHTATDRSRSLDILHVASAISLKFSQFVTMDGRQSDLAKTAGLKVISII